MMHVTSRDGTAIASRELVDGEAVDGHARGRRLDPRPLAALLTRFFDG